MSWSKHYPTKEAFENRDARLLDYNGTEYEEEIQVQYTRLCEHVEKDFSILGNAESDFFVNLGGHVQHLDSEGKAIDAGSSLYYNMSCK